MILNDLLNRLDKVSVKGDQYKALCPAHDDKKPSLAITEKDNKILLKCWSGCTTQDITSALGIELKDLFTDSGLNPQERQQYAKRKTARQCLEALEIEIHILYQCVVQLLHTDNPLTDEDQQRMSVAKKRLIQLIG